MDTERLSEVEELFHAAREREAADRGAFLDGACRGDLELRAEVESLLAHGTDGVANRPVLESASRVEERGPLQEGVGSTIGSYKLLQQLGEGGFGVVYMAEQKQPVRRRVALKIIKLGMDTKQVIARFEAERQALALMDHPNIAKVLDAGATQTGRPYFVMELVRGVPITDYCDKAGMSTADRLRLFVLVCRAVQHAHQKGIVHRDIKPSNVLVTLHDGEPVPKVIDFGIAKATNQELTEKTVFTEFHQFIGTPEYMSPEQAEMSGLDVDTRADVYSLGVLLYELLTGTTPVDPTVLRTAGYEEMQRILREDEPLRPSTRLSTMGADAAVVARKRQEDPQHLARSLRGDLDWIVLKALEKDRSRRYETAAGFGLDVERHLADEPVIASPPSRAYKLRKFVRRNRGPVTAAAVVFGVLLLGAGGTTAGFVRAQGALEREQQAHIVAIENGEVAREEARRQRALAAFFESSLLSTGAWEFGSPAPASVTDLLDLATARLLEGEMDDQPGTKAVLACAIGFAYMDRDRWEDALESLRLAIEWIPDETADPLTFSRAARELDRVDAEPYFELDVGVDVASLRQRALAALEPRIEADDPDVVIELFEWADILMLRDLPDDAARRLQSALRIARRTEGERPVYPVTIEFNLACAEARTGDEDAARRSYESATRSLREVVSSGDSRAAYDWVAFCEHPAIGLFMATEPPLKEVIALARERHPVRNLGMAETLWSGAGIQQDVGFADEAYEAMREAVEVARGFDENRLYLGSALVQLADFEWKRGKTDEVIELCREAKPLLAATRGRPRREAARLEIGVLVERIVGDPDAPGVPELVRRVDELADEASAGMARARRIHPRSPWWMLCGDVARMHGALARAGRAGDHARLARVWTDRLRSDLAPYLAAPSPLGHDGRCTDLAVAILALEDATRAELEMARELAALADATTGGLLSRPVDALARALFRLGDLEGAVREARRALDRSVQADPVRGVAARLERYETALAGGR